MINLKLLYVYFLKKNPRLYIPLICNIDLEPTRQIQHLSVCRIFYYIFNILFILHLCVICCILLSVVYLFMLYV